MLTHQKIRYNNTCTYTVHILYVISNIDTYTVWRQYGLGMCGARSKVALWEVLELLVLTGPFVSLVMQKGCTLFNEEDNDISVCLCWPTITMIYYDLVHNNSFVVSPVAFESWAHSIRFQSCNLPLLSANWLSLPLFPTRQKKLIGKMHHPWKIHQSPY